MSGHESIPPGALTEWRHRMGLSRRAASEALGCSRVALRRWEAGETPIPPYIGLAMAALSSGLHGYAGPITEIPE